MWFFRTFQVVLKDFDNSNKRIFTIEIFKIPKWEFEIQMTIDSIDFSVLNNVNLIPLLVPSGFSPQRAKLCWKTRPCFQLTLSICAWFSKQLWCRLFRIQIDCPRGNPLIMLVVSNDNTRFIFPTSMQGKEQCASNQKLASLMKSRVFILDAVDLLGKEIGYLLKNVCK